MAKIQAEWRQDTAGHYSLILTKSRGKLTVAEIGEFLQRYPHGVFQGNWCIIIQAGEDTCAAGWYEEPKGDAVELYQLGQGDNCPVCGQLVPNYQWCPECGASLKDEKGTVK